MNNRTKVNNILIAIFFLTLIASFVLNYLWRSDFKQTGLHDLSGLLCGGSSIILGVFLLILPGSIQNNFLKNSFLIHFMNAKEKEGDIIRLRARGFALMLLFSGFIVVATILSNYF